MNSSVALRVMKHLNSFILICKCCMFSDCSDDHKLEDKMLRDNIVFGVKSNEVQEKLIEQGSELTFKNTQI